MTEACAKTDGISTHSLNFCFLFSILILASYLSIVVLVSIGLFLPIIDSHSHSLSYRPSALIFVRIRIST